MRQVIESETILTVNDDGTVTARLGRDERIFDLGCCKANLSAAAAWIESLLYKEEEHG